MNRNLHVRTATLLLIMIAAGLFRFMLASGMMSPLMNFTPIGAIALFGGHYFSEKWKAFAVPIGILFVSDVFMNYFFFFHTWVPFYDGFLWVYGSFAVMVAMGWIMDRVTLRSVATAGVSAALAHWLITDLGVWLAHGTDITTGMPYTSDLTGLVKCYVLAIPFLQNMLAGNLLFGGLLFGGFEWLQRVNPSLRQGRHHEIAVPGSSL
jgi:hypothetical protein